MGGSFLANFFRLKSPSVQPCVLLNEGVDVACDVSDLLVRSNKADCCACGFVIASKVQHCG